MSADTLARGRMPAPAGCKVRRCLAQAQRQRQFVRRVLHAAAHAAANLGLISTAHVTKRAGQLGILGKQVLELSFKGLIRLLRFLWEHGPPRMKHVLLPLALVSGLSRDLMMIIINKSAAASLDDALGTWMPLFAASLLMVLATAFIYHVLSTSVTTYITNKVRVEMIGNLLKAQPSFIDKHQHGAIYHILTTDVGIVASFLTTVLNLLPSLIFLMIAMPQLFYYSPVAGAFALLVMGGGTFAYYYQQKLLATLNADARQLDVDYFEQVSEALHGIRELRLNIPRRKSFMDQLHDVLEKLRDVLIRVKKIYEIGELATSGLKFVLFGGIVFLVPYLVKTEATVTFQLLTFVLFSFIPFEQIVSSYPTFIAALVTFWRINDLNTRLKPYEQIREEMPDVVPQFRTIRAEGIVARHHSSETSDFVLGPIDFELKRGELVFFVGHNGSGKTTFMNVLAGLFDPDEGRILVDGKPLGPDDMATYRARISAIFSNYHVFRDLHGLEHVSKQDADEIIKRVWLYQLTETKDGKFSRLHLSAGQKRRLALAVTLMENRDLIILDEYLADQDPEQRAYFFKTLLPMMKKQGKTIIFSTHDLQWIYCADKVYQFDNGKMKDITQVKQAAPKLETA